jgi:hypothetical protein
MGSLLSFPILCVANAATYGLVHGIDNLSDVDCVINGDDILFISSYEKIKEWKFVATKMGLEPSIGKNYLSSSFGSINSQLFYRKRNNCQLKMLKTGKFRTILSKKVLDTKTAFENGFSEKDLATFSKHLLQKTPQSLDIPLEYGGLGRSFNYIKRCSGKVTRTDRRIYLEKISELSDVKEIINFPENGLICISGPKYYLNRFRPFFVKNNSLINKSRITDQISKENLLNENSNESMFKFNKKIFSKIQRNPHLRNFLNHGNLEKSPPLSLFKTEVVLIPSKILNSVKINVKSEISKNLTFI